MSIPPNASEPSKLAIATVTLEEPIVRGETTIGLLQLRKPRAGELRGLNLAELTQLGVDSMIVLLPRISSPPITEAEAAGICPADLFLCAIEVAGFFMPAGMAPTALASAPERTH